jgi:hypothetical protein
MTNAGKYTIGIALKEIHKNLMAMEMVFPTVVQIRTVQ